MKRTMKILITTILAIVFPLLAKSAFATFVDGKRILISILSEPSAILFFGMMLVGVAGFSKKFRTTR